jgi:hypothetical protein
MIAGIVAAQSTPAAEFVTTELAFADFKTSTYRLNGSSAAVGDLFDGGFDAGAISGDGMLVSLANSNRPRVKAALKTAMLAALGGDGITIRIKFDAAQWGASIAGLFNFSDSTNAEGYDSYIGSFYTGYPGEFSIELIVLGTLVQFWYFDAGASAPADGNVVEVTLNAPIPGAPRRSTGQSNAGTPESRDHVDVSGLSVADIFFFHGGGSVFQATITEITILANEEASA